MEKNRCASSIDEASRAVRGFNLMGIRYRADVCLKWIDSQTPVEAVLPKLALANFDPELYRQHEADMIQAFNQQGGFSLQLKPKRSLKKVFAFLKD
jgi:3-phenylpropionate/trans-cinnamate dioxygenase ferredoxin reductase subunit